MKVGAQCCGRAVEHRKSSIVTDTLTDPLFVDGRAGAVASPIRAAFSVPVMDENVVSASLACHFTQAHEPSKLDIERNEVFARLFAISLRARRPVKLAEPQFSYSPDANFDLEPAKV